MRVTVQAPGDEAYTVAVSGETDADLLGRLGVSRQEVAVLVDDRPVPEDREADADTAVVRLVGGR